VKKIALIGGILFVPAIIVLIFLNIGKNNYQKLPFYGEKSPVISSGNQVDTIYHQVSTFFDSYNQKYSPDSIQNRIWMASFLQPSCGEPCGFAYTQWKRLQDALIESPSLKFINFYPTESMTKSQLDSVVKRYEFDENRVFFVGIPQDSISSFLKQQYLISNYLLDTKEWQIVLMDYQQRIRSYFNLTKKREIDDLMGALTVLTKEKNLEEVAKNKK
jgi:hypothetical protein